MSRAALQRLGSQTPAYRAITPQARISKYNPLFVHFLASNLKAESSITLILVFFFNRLATGWTVGGSHTSGDDIFHTRGAQSASCSIGTGLFPG